MISFEQLKTMQIFNFESFFFSIKICNIYKYVKTKTNLKVILRNLLELRESYDVKKKTTATSRNKTIDCFESSMSILSFQTTIFSGEQLYG